MVVLPVVLLSVLLEVLPVLLLVVLFAVVVLLDADSDEGADS